jgi:hypothetical protein
MAVDLRRSAAVAGAIAGGGFNSGDISLVKSKSGTALP